MLWENETLTKNIIERLQNGQNEIDSREYLRPIFKWTKLHTKYYDIDKAFEFASYMVKLSKEGDVDRNILIQKTLQPVYAYNTLVLMSQRISEPKYGMLAFNEMKKNNYDIDVFTLTALLDVIGRSNDQEFGLKKSLDIFYEMLESSKYDSDNNKKLRPNVVTFVTLMRLIGKKLEDDNNRNEIIDDTGDIVLNLLNLAHELSLKENHTVGAEVNQIDMSIYNAALAVTVRSLDEKITLNILQIMKDRNAELNELSIRILGKLVYKLNDKGIQFIKKLVEINFITSSQYSLINDSANSRDDENSKLPLSIQRNKDRDIDCLNTSRDRDVKYDNDIALALKQRNKIQGLGSSYAGCLGPDAPETLRHSIVIHDTTKLIEKTYEENGGNIYRVTESCFVTLIHSCRKRKWVNQVKYILEFVKNLVDHGVPEKNILPLTHIGPTYLLYEAALDAYFAMDLVDNALELYNQIDFNSIFDDATEDKSKEYSFFSFLIKGFFQCGNSVYALKVFSNMKSRNIIPTLKLLQCMMRGLGAENSFQDGIQILNELSQSSSTTTFISSLLCILLESSAILNNNTKSIEFIETWKYSSTLSTEFKQSIELMINIIDSEFTTICLMLAVSSSSSLDIANDYITKWQELGIFPPFSFLSIICNEAITSSNPNAVTKSYASLPFKSFIRNGPVRLVDSKRSYIKRILMAIKEACDTPSTPSWVSLREPWISLICKRLPLSSTSFINSVNFTCTDENDCYINHYFHYCFCTDDNNDSIGLVSGALLFQYLWTKLINIRSKNGKIMIQNSLQNAFKSQHDDESNNDSKISHFINIILRASTYTYLGGKPISKILSLIFDELEKFRKSSYMKDDVAIPIIINGIEIALLSLDVIREFTKAIPILMHIDGRRLVLSSLLDILENDREKSIKVIQYIYSNKMLIEDDNSKSDSMRLVQERIENVLFRIVISDPNANWNSLVTYVSSCNEQHDTCKRLIRTILSLDDSFEIKDICQKLLKRMELTDVVEFSHLWKKFSLVDDIDSNIDSNYSNENDDYLELPDDVVIMIINNDNQIDDVESILSSSNIIGIDVEWRPFASSSLANKCSLLQIACKSNIFLFDLMSLEKKWMNECDDDNDNDDDDYCPNFRNLLKHIFSSESILKLGFGLSGDFNRLSVSFPNSEQYNFKDLKNYLDLSMLHRCRNKSLAVACKEYLSKSLDKRLQRSDWQRRPLLNEQIKYAAIDAYVLIILYEKLNDNE